MSGQQAENSLHENSIGWMIILALLAIVFLLIWFFLDTEIKNFIRWIRYGEMWVASFVISFLENAGVFGSGDAGYHINFNGKDYSWFAGFELIPQIPAAQLEYEHMLYISAMAMEPWKYIFVAILIASALWCMKSGPNTQYRDNLGLEGLIKRQSEIFPVIQPFIEFNPSTQPPRPPGAPVPAELPRFAEALGPEEWLAYNEIATPDGQLKEEGLFKAFRQQLGPRWKGPKALEPFKQVLLAAFCLKAARKRKEADIFLGRLAKCWSFKEGMQLSKDKTLLQEARSILRDKKMSGETMKKINQHAYETTAMLRALQVAREEGGVLAPAQFVWMRGHNRTLWYPLNNLGRQSFHMEALGAMSHFVAEKRTSRPIPVAKMEGAIETITEYMNSSRKRPIPQLDYSASKKRGIKKAI